MKATYGVDFFGCWRVMLGPECNGKFATRRDAKAFCEEYNKEQEEGRTSQYVGDAVFLHTKPHEELV